MKIQYCVECGQKLKHLKGICYICPQKHYYYNNPRAAVAVVLINEHNEVLVSKRGIEPRKGTYDLPGGFLEPGESIQEGASREMNEETTIKIGEVQIVTSYDAEYLENIYVCDLIVHAKSWEGSPIAQDDSSALEWKPLEFLNSAMFSAPYPNIEHTLKDYLKLVQ